MPTVTLLIGSKSDSDAIRPALQQLERFGVSCQPVICSAHRAPERLRQVVRDAEAGGTQLFICGAGLAAALPGAVAGLTYKPVIGLPLAAGALNGIDSLLSIVQMPPGVPVATVGINAAANAANLAIQILALSDDALAGKLASWRQEQSTRIDTFE